MSPEHVRGTAIDSRSDVWSLGVLLHEMLTGVRPFDGADAASVADAILNREPNLVATSHPEVPAAIERVLRRALTKSPDSRYQSMTVFTADLLALVPAADPAAFGPGGPPRIALTGQPEVAPVTERRAATVLVTLVSDYGSLVERMAPAEARALVAGLRDMAVDAVRRHGGVVNQAIGEEIVSLFGVLAAHGDDELRAVRAAIELHARVGEIGAASAPVPAYRSNPASTPVPSSPSA